MKILLVDDTLNVGGKERLVLTSLRCLPRDRMSVHLCLTGCPGALGDEALRLADGSIVLGRRAPFSPVVARALRRYVVSNGIDILHCNGTVDLLHAWAATRGLGARLICSVHGYASGAHLPLGKFLLARCDAALPVSESLLADLKKDGYRARIFRVIPNCYDPAFECSTSPVSASASPGRLSLVCVSRFDWSKDQLTLVRALKSVVDGGRDVTLDFAGSGLPHYVEPVTKAAGDLGLSSRVRFLGTCRDIPALLHRYDAFVLSSFAESFGIAAVEAMASGLPVALSDIPPFREIVREGSDGMLFPAGSAEAAAACMAQLCDSPELRAELGRKSFLRSRDFSPEAYAAKLTSFYSELMGSPAASRHDGRPGA
jgi:glycosyltransferase involved in cell wall biosynthesis